MKLAVIGVGLIGGSFALALKQAKAVSHVVGVGRNAANLKLARERGIIDSIAPDPGAAARDADLVLVAAPVAQFAGIFESISANLGAKTLVTDGGSTKRDVIAAARKALGKKIGRFVPAHPIAGAEKSGAAAANAELYRGKRVVLTPLPENRRPAVEQVEAAWKACGARVSRMDPEEHDAVLATVSHLPHVLAYALVYGVAKRNNSEQLFSFAAGGFRDFTRIASSHPEMWRDICLANRDRVLQELKSYANELGTIRKLIQKGDAAGLEKVFAAARDAREQMDSIELKPAARAAGTVRLPGSKSISNRVLLLAALAAGETEVLGALDADDTRVMRDALSQLGVTFSENKVKGVGGVFPVKKAELFLGNAGTAFRPLTAALAFSAGEYRLSGVPRMHERPIGDLVDALRGIGARVDYTGKEGYPPLAVHPGKISLEKLRVRGDVSSQFLTALLMALPLSGKAARIEVQGELISKPYVEITLNVMKRFGVEVKRTGWRYFDVPAATYRSPGKILVEGDASSASYFLAAGALGGGPVRVEGVGRGSIQGDLRFTEVLERMGARISMGDDWVEASGGQKLKPIDLDLNHIPDAAMTAAVLALFADGPSIIRNVASWRVKETDRLAAMATELRKLGADVEEGTDYLKIFPRKIKPGVAIDTYDDHRMAMSFALAALGGVPVTINDPQCVAKTFPDYFTVFNSIAS